MNLRAQLFYLPLCLLSMACVTPALSNTSFFSGRYKINCTDSPEGCSCTSGPDTKDRTATVFHAQPVISTSTTDATLGAPSAVELRINGKSCFYPSQNLRPIYWETDICPQQESEAKVPIRPLNELLGNGSATGEKVSLGSLYPTYYNIADEAFHPGPKTDAIYEAVSGKLIAYITRSFHEDLDMEGTGRLNDGRVINVANYVNKIWDYRVLSGDAFGIGILGHNLHPYRSVAVDFVHLCTQAGLDFCTQPKTEVRKRLVGALLYMPRLRDIPLPNGTTHDGYVCAQDIGGAIQADRVDIFVGPLGGGNPYLKECRQRNPLIDSGVQSLVPTDWRTYEANGVDDLGKPQFKRTKEFEYRTVAASKGLDTYLVRDAFCKP